MPAKIIDGTKIAKDLLAQVKQENTGSPVLAVVLVGENPASLVYIEKKRVAAKKVGIKSKLFSFCESIPEQDVIEQVKKLNEDSSVNGILVQLPLPKHIDRNNVLNTISPAKDVDGFTPENMGKLVLGEEEMVSCTALGIIKLIESLGARLEGKNCCIVNDSIVVGRPLAQLLLNRKATVCICNKFTKDLASYTKKADILVTAAGVPKLISGEMVKPGAIVIDAGITRENGKIAGDIDFELVSKVASHITPVPGGVGPMTVACLMQNTLKAEESQRL